MRWIPGILLAVCVMLFVPAPSSGEIGWAGQVWPVHGSSHDEDLWLDVYLEIWKEGVTDLVGRGSGISATLYHGPDGGPYDHVLMTYHADAGNNDTYVAMIPREDLYDELAIRFYCEVYDSSDASTYNGARDQNANDPPFLVDITHDLDREVTVTFFLCMPPEGHPDYDPDPRAICITGEHEELTVWGEGIETWRPCEAYSPRYYEVSVVFDTGSDRYVEYSYRKDSCTVIETVAPHALFIDDSGPEYIVTRIDHWNDYVGDDCLPCWTQGVRHTTWSGIKAMYR